MQYLRILLSSFGEDFQRFASNFLYSYCLWLYLPIMQLVPPFEQTRITHTKGLFVCNIYEFCSVVFEKKIFKGLHEFCNVQIVFGYYFANNVGGATI